jgi:hypothetical protein
MFEHRHTHLWVALSCGVVATLVAQVNEGFCHDHYDKKERFYCDRYPVDAFLLLPIVNFGCLR